MKPDPYDHAQECKRIGLPYYAWCCADCAERAGADFSHGASYAHGGWCQVGKHRVASETKWLEVDPDAVMPWAADPAYDAARRRYAEQPAELRAVIDSQYNSGLPTHARFIDCVALVLDI